MARRRMSALQRKYFGPRARRSYRASARRAARTVYRPVKRYYRKNVAKSSWLPLTMEEHATAAITGVSAPLVSYGAKKYLPEQVTSALGDYADEFYVYGAGALAHKFGPASFVKNLGKDHARLAVMSASNQTFSPMIGSALGITGTSSLGGSLATLGYA